MANMGTNWFGGSSKSKDNLEEFVKITNHTIKEVEIPYSSAEGSTSDDVPDTKNSDKNLRCIARIKKDHPGSDFTSFKELWLDTNIIENFNFKSSYELACILRAFVTFEK